MKKKPGLIWLLLILLIFLAIQCDKATNPTETKGTISGIVSDANGTAIYPAYIFTADTLLTTGDESGKYTIPALEAGSYLIIFSALNYRDTTLQIQVTGGKTTTQNFNLTADATTARVLGEFQDLVIFNDSLITRPDLKDWEAKRIFEEVTGATLQAKTLGYDIPPCQLFLGDSLLTISDPFGQFWFKIQCGTYPIKGSSEGYESTTQIIKIMPDTRHYLNFYLNR